MAAGDYIIFIDSDDIISIDLCECMYEMAVRNGYVDILQFKSKDFNDGEEANFDEFKIDKSDFSVYKRKSKDNPFKALNLSYNVVWDKMWKTSFIKENNLRFKEGLSIGEDNLFSFLHFLRLKVL